MFRGGIQTRLQPANVFDTTPPSIDPLGAISYWEQQQTVVI
jgi:hypothetical protein